VKNPSRHIAAVEIGTSKINVLIGQITPGRGVSLIGFGECQANGVAKGVITDFKQASDATHAALVAAEQDARVKIDEVFLAQTGGHLRGFHHPATVNVESAENLVSRNDMQRACELAMSKELEDGRIVVQYLQRPYLLDGKMVGPNPERLHGEKLEGGCWTVHGDQAVVTNSIHVIQGFNLKVADMILSSLAAGTMLTTQQDRQQGVLMIDIGAGTSDFVYYRHGVPFITGVVAVGGGHLTNDLALGLRVTEGQAEKLKLRHGRGVVASRDKSDKVWLNGDLAIGDRQFPRMAIETITAARVQEIFEVVKKKLGFETNSDNCPAGVILTGGTSRLPHIEDAATRVFGVPAHLGELPAWVGEKLSHPAHSTVLGLLHYGITGRSDTALVRRKPKRTFLRKLFATA